jgi:hypothetical protein
MRAIVPLATLVATLVAALAFAGLMSTAEAEEQQESKRSLFVKYTPRRVGI